MSIARVRASLLVVGGLLCFACGCSHTGESASRDKLTSNVGKYDAAPQTSGEKPRVAVPQFKVQVNGGVKNTNNLKSIAADQMTTLLDQTEPVRRSSECSQLENCSTSRTSKGIVSPTSWRRPVPAAGGPTTCSSATITNLRVKRDQTKSGFNLGGIGGARWRRAVRCTWQQRLRPEEAEHPITTECGVDIRLVDPTHRQDRGVAVRRVQADRQRQRAGHQRPGHRRQRRRRGVDRGGRRRQDPAAGVRRCACGRCCRRSTRRWRTAARAPAPPPP